ncbi:AAA family ATPase [Streptomyces griseoaurantiacus]|uniref:AAA family ATPase n=1 Tax=Streptomyces griseoaurantiacus TaxID=68213 RepID=UPI002E2DB5F2|nr:AAA family ATPase [Streptomyces jietaisiensis]
MTGSIPQNDPISPERRELDFSDPVIEVFDFLHSVYGKTLPVMTFLYSSERKPDAKGRIKAYPKFYKRARPTARLIRDLLELGKKPGHEIFYRVAPMGKDGSRTTEADVLPFNVFWAEVDDHGLTADDWAFLKSIGATVVYSGGKTDDGEPKTQILARLRSTPTDPMVNKELSRALRDRLGGDAVQDLTRMLRLPGSYHRKDQSAEGGKLCTTQMYARRRALSAPEAASALGTDVSSARVRSRAERASIEPVEPPTRKMRDAARKARRTVDGQIYEAREHRGEAVDLSERAWGLYKDLARAGITEGEHIMWAAKDSKELGHRVSGRDVARFLVSQAYEDAVAEGRETSSEGVEQPGDVPHPSDGASVAESDDEPEAERFPSLDWATAWTQDYSSPDWLLGKFLERAQQIAFVAGGKDGKSLLILHWCLALVLGWEFFGDKGDGPENSRKGKGARVLYFDRENNLRDIITRARSLGVTDKDLAALSERFVYKQFPAFDGTLDDPEANAAEQLLAIVEEVKPDVVILDTASRFIKGNENDSAPWLQLYRLVHAPLKARGAAAVRIDHFGKDETKGARGNSAKAQDVDHVWEMTVKAERKERKPDGEWVVITLGMKRTHTRTGHGADSFTVVRRGKKDAEGMWADGCTSHELEGQQDRFDEVAEGLADAEKLWEYMRARVGSAITARAAAEVIGKSSKTAERILQGFERDPMRKTQISKGKVDRANAWTYIGTSVV